MPSNLGLYGADYFAAMVFGAANAIPGTYVLALLTTQPDAGYTGAQLNEPWLLTPTNVSLSTVGTPGGSTYGYRVSAVNTSGETLASTTVTIATGPGTPNGTNYVQVQWTAVTDAVSYNIYGRTSGSELLLGSVTAPTTVYNDQGATPLGSLPASNTSGFGYQRVSVTNNTSTNFNVAIGGIVTNKATFTFPLATGDWGTMTHFALVDATNGGNMYLYGSLDVPRFVASGHTFNWTPGYLGFSFVGIQQAIYD